MMQTNKKYHTEDMRTVEYRPSFLGPKGVTLKNVWVMRSREGKYLDHGYNLHLLLEEHELRIDDLFEVE